MESIKENRGHKVSNAIDISLKIVLIVTLRTEINLFVSQKPIIHLKAELHTLYSKTKCSIDKKRLVKR